MLKIFNKGIYPRDWPLASSDTNRPNFVFKDNNQIAFKPESVTIIYDKARFTDGQKAYLLSMFQPENKNAYFVELHDAVAKRLLAQINLQPQSYIIFADYHKLISKPLFLANKVADELDALMIGEIASEIEYADQQVDKVLLE